ncbi:unnamed protein product [Lactuca virosa]|uniref:Uncharacterized protein n=1 Tax=Lactuca virosa TaxID=75947 RepID=A0AAU9NSE7_9ASTR|nr:unnamed protein product [Lactuca virosa]
MCLLDQEEKEARKLPETSPATPFSSTDSVAVLEKSPRVGGDRSRGGLTLLPAWGPYFPAPPAVGMPILIEDSEPEEDPTEDLEEMEHELEEDPIEDPKDMEQELEEEREPEAYESIGDVTPMKEEEHVASPTPLSYYLGSGIPRNRKHTQKTIPMCGGVKKKNPRMRVHSFPSLTENFHQYHAALVEPALNPMSEASRATQERRMQDPAWITDVVNEWVQDQEGTHRFKVG